MTELTSSGAALTLLNIRKRYGEAEVIHGINLSVKPGEFVVFVGPSGCGKSTILRMIAGLEEISSGEFHINGVLMNDVSPAKRNLSMVFQSYALYPHMNVFNNLAFALKMAKLPQDEITRRVHEAAEILQLEDYLTRYPKALSGGQRQRVAIGRAIVRQPVAFLFDEPLSNLDAGLRNRTRVEIAKLHKQLKATMVYVTHDQTEAMTLADRIVILNHGRIEQIGMPMELYEKPHNKFVAGFIGSSAMNFLPIGCGMKLPRSYPKNTVEVGIRPENLTLAETAAAAKISVRQDICEQMGEYILMHGTSGEHKIIAKLGAQAIASSDFSGTVGLDYNFSHLHFFDAAGKVL